MLTIGICGASGSGKSTLAHELQQRIHGRVILLNQDAYYKDHSELSFEMRKQVNYDEPAVFEHDQLLADVVTLLSGQPITRKGYDYSQHRRADSDELVFPGDALVIEGIHTFYDRRLRDLMDLKIYMSVDPDICLLRRVQRDINERGRDIDGVATQYLATVRPMYNKYIRGYVEYADLIVAGGGRNQTIVKILASYINSGAMARPEEEDGE